MQTMKKLLLVFLAFGSMFALTACPDSGDGADTTTTETTTTDTHSGEHSGDMGGETTTTETTTTDENNN